jgi:hypothetical protein
MFLICIMEQKIKEIIIRAGELNNRIGRLLNENPPPAIELDIILGDIRTLYDEIKSLQHPGAKPGSPAKQEPAAQPESLKPKEPAAQKEPVAEKEPAADVAAKPEPAVTAVPKPDAANGSGPAKSKTPGEAPKQGPATLADKYKGEKKFMNETLAGGLEKKDIGSKIQSTPIKNIGSSLGINDRFKLINELFNGDKDSYQDTINALDDSANFNGI